MWKVMQETRDDVRDLKGLLNPALTDMRKDIDLLDEREQKHHDEHATAIRELQEALWSSKWVPLLAAGALASIISGVVMYVITNIPH